MKRTMALLLAGAVAGCTVGPNFRPPEVPSPATYANQDAALPSRTYGGSVDASWWSRFSDPELDSLIGRLAAQNLDLQAAAEQIEQARAQIIVTRAEGLPHIGSSVGYNRVHESRNGFISLVQPSPDSVLEYNEYKPTASVSWELDLFGRVRREAEAARADAEAMVESRHAIALSAISELAQDYMQLRQTQAQTAILLQNDNLAKQRTKLVQDRFAQGAATTLDVAQAVAQVSTIEQDLPILQEREAALSNAIALLLAQPPHAVDAELASRPGVQPFVPPLVPVGLPGELIRRRPDIRQAEAQLHAATAQTGVAVASFYPDISLTGDFGFDSLHPGSLFDWASRSFMVGPTLSLPIFQGGALKGRLLLAKSNQREAAITFHKTVLQAWHDVDNAMTAYAQGQRAQADSVATTIADRNALAAATRQYEEGATSFLDVVQAQSALLASQYTTIAANARTETSLIVLYKALGGGWETVADAPERSDSISRRKGTGSARSGL